MIKTFFAEIFSIFFHPIVFALLLPLIVVYRQSSSSLYALKWMIFSSLFVFVGVILLLIARWKGIFSDFDISKKEERPLFYYVALFLALAYFLVSLLIKGLFFSLSIVALGIVLALIVFRIVNHFAKASIHVASVSAFILTIIILFNLIDIWGLLLLSIIFFVGWSRVFLKKHKLNEVVIGGIFGILITVIIFLIAKYIYG
ncbi:MAG: hypothetical protein M1524_00660 [Patescibacteria group bacterium]|nr:hypothetical protein [Patescibacteria group bacterium]